MARRQKNASRIPVLLSALIVGLVLAGSGVAVWMITDPNRTKSRLDTEAYLANPTRFAGNHYLIEASIANRIASNERGTVYSVLTNDRPLAITVPRDATPSFNLEKGQTLWIDLRIAENGTAIATGFNKK